MRKRNLEGNVEEISKTVSKLELVKNRKKTVIDIIQKTGPYPKVVELLFELHGLNKHKKLLKKRLHKLYINTCYLQMHCRHEYPTDNDRCILCHFRKI